MCTGRTQDLCHQLAGHHPGLLREQVELLALIRDTGVTAAQLRILLQLSPGALQAGTVTETSSAATLTEAVGAVTISMYRAMSLRAFCRVG